MCLVQLHERRLSGAYDIYFSLTCGLWVFKKRDIIRKDIQKQKKERAKQAQREKRERENMQ